MNSLIDSHNRTIEELDWQFDRDLSIDWNDRLIGVTGARGVGKTTYLLHHIKNKLPNEAKALYVSVDDIYFTTNTLVDFADDWIKRGGTHLFLDEIHKYENWSQELKNIYDRYRKLNVVFTGSSLLHIYKGKADLSRRAVLYTMNGLSFREYLQIETKQALDKYSLEEIITNHESLSKELVKKVKPFVHFEAYLKNGYYPFYLESTNSYHRKLMNTITLMLEVDLPYLRHVDVQYIHKLKKLLYLVATAVPFQPNVSKLAADIGVSRNTVMLYLTYLEESRILNLLRSNASSDAVLAKPEKVFLHHPNTIYALTRTNFQEGTLRECFFYNQVANVHDVTSSVASDFLVDNKYTFEIGGKSKTRKQLKNVKESYIAADNIEYGDGKTIPLWLFGFLY
jgi:predicted AAA+ superfamily ATPase